MTSNFADDCRQVILDRLESGEALTKICKDDGLPSAPTFLRWCDKEQGLAEQYARATQLGYDARAEQAVEDAKSAKDAALGRLAFDADRWWLGKRAPKKYGEKLELSGDADNPMNHKIEATVRFVRNSED